MRFDTDRGTLREFPKIKFPSPKKGEKMKIQFTTDNEAFAEDNRGYETARILRYIADLAEDGYREGPIMDVNGNTIGHWSY